MREEERRTETRGTGTRAENPRQSPGQPHDPRPGPSATKQDFDSPVHDYLAPTRAVLGLVLAASPLVLSMPALAATIVVVAGLLILAVSAYNTWKTRSRGAVPGRGACVTSLVAGIVVVGTPLYVTMGTVAMWFTVLTATLVVALSGVDLSGTTGKRRIHRVTR